jgi:hypothetical protein
MRSSRPKVLHAIGGRSLIAHVGRGARVEPFSLRPGPNNEVDSHHFLDSSRLPGAGLCDLFAIAITQLSDAAEGQNSRCGDRALSVTGSGIGL